MANHLTAGGEFIVLGIILLVLYQAINVVFRKWRRSRMKYSPVSNEEVDKMMNGLPKHLRSSTRRIQETYELFGNREIRFSLRPADPAEDESFRVACLRLIVDEKLCLFFYQNEMFVNCWHYDGFEAGDYTNDFREGEIG